MTLTTHPNSVPDALVATLPTTHRPTDTVEPDHRAVVDDPNRDRFGQRCGACAVGTYGAGPGAGHVTCDECGHATVRRGTVGRRRR